MGNGLFGALIWGEDSINITINRADFWDHRVEYRPKEGVTTYENIKKSYNPTESSWIESFLPRDPKPLCVANPSRLPFGRFEMKLKPECVPAKGELDLDKGSVTIWVYAAGSKVRHPVKFDLSVNQNVLWIQDPDKMICGVTVKTAWGFVGERLRGFGFPEPVFVEETEIWGWAQECPADPAMAAICQKAETDYVIALERGVDAGKAIAAAGKLALGALKEGLKPLRNTNGKWRKAYWKRVPQITLPDDFFNKFYLYALYKFGAATNPQCLWPTGLQGPWVEKYQWPPWNTDYHFWMTVSAQLQVIDRKNPQKSLKYVCCGNARHSVYLPFGMKADKNFIPLLDGSFYEKTDSAYRRFLCSDRILAAQKAFEHVMVENPDGTELFKGACDFLLSQNK
jgi:hypothetical protein